MGGRTPYTKITTSIEKIDKYIDILYNQNFESLSVELLNKINESIEQSEDALKQMKLDVESELEKKQPMKIACEIDDKNKEIILW